jgi:hypothetical protein
MTRGARRVVVTGFVGLALLAVGCRPWTVTTSAGIGLGWLLGYNVAQTQTGTQCFQNGVQIDCADLPADLSGS